MNQRDVPPAALAALGRALTPSPALYGRLPLSDERALPLEGASYSDAVGRLLYVEKVRVKDPLGREVTGLISHDGTVTGRIYRYSTDVKTWAAIWRDRQAPLDPMKMKVG